jgi:hypothetical protein
LSTLTPPSIRAPAVRLTLASPSSTKRELASPAMSTRPERSADTAPALAPAEIVVRPESITLTEPTTAPAPTVRLALDSSLTSPSTSLELLIATLPELLICRLPWTTAPSRSVSAPAPSASTEPVTVAPRSTQPPAPTVTSA